MKNEVIARADTETNDHHEIITKAGRFYFKPAARQRFRISKSEALRRYVGFITEYQSCFTNSPETINRLADSCLGRVRQRQQSVAQRVEQTVQLLNRFRQKTGIKKPLKRIAEDLIQFHMNEFRNRFINTAIRLYLKDLEPTSCTKPRSKEAR